SALAGALRASLAGISSEEQEQISVNRLDRNVSIPERLKKFQTSIAICQTGVDPLFGFSCVPTALLRNFIPVRMAEAFIARAGDQPAPAKEGEPLKIALSACADLGLSASIEVVGGGEPRGI